MVCPGKKITKTGQLSYTWPGFTPSRLSEDLWFFVFGLWIAGRRVEKFDHIRGLNIGLV